MDKINRKYRHKIRSTVILICLESIGLFLIAAAVIVLLITFRKPLVVDQWKAWSRWILVFGPTVLAAVLSYPIEVALVFSAVFFPIKSGIASLRNAETLAKKKAIDRIADQCELISIYKMEKDIGIRKIIIKKISVSSDLISIYAEEEDKNLRERITENIAERFGSEPLSKLISVSREIGKPIQYKTPIIGKYCPKCGKECTVSKTSERVEHHEYSGTLWYESGNSGGEPGYEEDITYAAYTYQCTCGFHYWEEIEVNRECRDID